MRNTGFSRTFAGTHPAFPIFKALQENAKQSLRRSASPTRLKPSRPMRRRCPVRLFVASADGLMIGMDPAFEQMQSDDPWSMTSDKFTDPMVTIRTSSMRRKGRLRSAN